MKGIVEALFILGLSLSLAWFVWFWHPNAPQFGEEGLEQSIEEVLSWEALTWVDARTLGEFEEDRIPGAILLNEEDWENLFGELMLVWDPEVPLVVYCESSACLRSHDAAKRLKEELGVENVYVLANGWKAWLESQGKGMAQ
ncbi:MAG: rhodanese-like domain-containing protein [Verrucomicrobiota bacterium]